MVDRQCYLEDLLPASYKGVPFWVESDKITFGRRITTHEYPMRPTPFNEDMGQKAVKMTITGYVVGEFAKEKKDAVVAACRARGNGLLQMPGEDAQLAVCDTLSVDRTYEKQGFYKLEFAFTNDDDAAAGGIVAIPIFDTLIGTMAGGAIFDFASLYDTGFSCFGVLPYVVDNAVGIMQAFAGTITDYCQTYPLIGSETIQAQLMADAANLYGQADYYAQPLGYTAFNQGGFINRVNSYGDLIGTTVNSGVSRVPQYDPSAFPVVPGSVNPLAANVVPVIADMMGKLQQLLSPADAVTVFTELSSYSVGEVGMVTYPNLVGTLATVISGAANANQISASDLANGTNSTLLNSTIRSFGLMNLAQAVIANQWGNRQALIQARADVVELFNAQIDQAGDDATGIRLTTVRDTCVKGLMAKMTTLNEIDYVELSNSMPSLFIACLLYNNAERADELIALNDAGYPAFMPVKLLAYTS